MLSPANTPTVPGRPSPTIGTAGTKGRFPRDKRGNVTLMFAGALPVIMGCAAFAVDMGYLYAERRHAQGAVDLAAMAAAADLDTAETNARSTLTANDIDTLKSLVVTKGNYRPDRSLHHAARFKPGQEPYTPSTSKP